MREHVADLPAAPTRMTVLARYYLAAISFGLGLLLEIASLVAHALGR